MDPEVAADPVVDERLRSNRPGARTDRPATVALFMASAVLPWLNPLAGGPSAVIQPWLVAASLTLLLWVLTAPAVKLRDVGFAILLVAMLVGFGHAAPHVLLAVGGRKSVV